MKNRKLHVVIIPSWYPTMDMPLSGIFFKEQAEALSKSEVQVGLIYPETNWLSHFRVKKLKDYYFQIVRKYEGNVNTFRSCSWNMFPKSKKLQSKQWIYEAKRLFKNYIKLNGKPDIIHAHSVLWGGYVAYLLSKSFQIPYVITEHSSSFSRGFIKSWEIPYIEKAFSCASEVIAVSSPFSKLLSSYCEHKDITVVPNMVDTDYFYYKQKADTDNFVFLFTSFLTPIKGADVLIKAFSKSFCGNEHIKLKIAGEGVQKQELVKLVDRLNIKSQVEFLGLLSREDVRDNLWNANVFVLPSYYETFGVVLIEAMSTGTPVISTKCGGPEDIVVEKVGRLVECGDVEGLSKELEYIHSNYNSYNSNHIRKHAVEMYGSNSVIKKLIGIYTRVLTRDK